LIDLNARYKKREERLVPKSFYGELLNIYEVPLPSHRLLEDAPVTLLLAVVKPCNAIWDAANNLSSYTGFGPVEVIDLNAIQAVVGRVNDRGCWTIIDRSGDLARAAFTGQDD
jgi:hypothetical protein